MTQRSTDPIRAHVFVSGIVQGVFYRGNTQKTARALGLTDWVRNLPDGRVEAVFEGRKYDVEKALAWCQIGSPSSRVERVDARIETPTGEFRGFRTRW